MRGDWHRAEDAAQDALVRIYRRWPKLNREHGLNTYAHKVVVSAVLDQAKRPWRRERATAEPTEPPRPQAEPDHAGTIDTRQLVVAALAQLPAGQRACVVLRHYADRPDATQPAGTSGQTFRMDVTTGKLIDPVSGRLIEPPPSVSPLADAEIIRRCGPSDKAWREHLPPSGDKAGPINSTWSVPLKTGLGDGFQAVILSPDRAIAATCQLKGNPPAEARTATGGRRWRARASLRSCRTRRPAPRSAGSR